MNTLLIAILSILLSVVAQFSLKQGMSGSAVRDALAQPFTMDTAVTVLTDKFVVGGFVLYGLGAVVWLAVLAKWDVSRAYPLVGLGFVFTLLVGLMLGEQVTLLRALGVTLICFGVFLIARG